ncbi:MAG: hypothetical protein U0350_36420 [Caldilineaceae bacterium]
MAYSSIPTKSAGDTVRSADFNQLADNAAYVAGLADAVVIPFSAVQSGDGSGISDIWTIRHTHRWLLVRLIQMASTSDYVEVYYNGTQVFSDGGDRAAPYTWNIAVDLNDTGAISPTPTTGNYYEITLNIGQKTGSGVTKCAMIQESTVNSL